MQNEKEELLQSLRFAQNALNEIMRMEKLEEKTGVPLDTSEWKKELRKHLRNISSPYGFLAKHD
jgi:hypothetical protein